MTDDDRSPASSDLEARLARVVERHILDGVVPPLEELCADRPDLIPALGDLVRRYLEASRRLDEGAFGSRDWVNAPPPDAGQPPGLPVVDGFRTIERIGAGGMGEVYKLEDLRLGRVVAAKIVRGAVRAQALADFLAEARALALFDDPRIVRIHEFRPDATPPVIIMELVDGFELGHIGPSLEFAQRARVMKEVCDALHRAHGLGIQHRDLKPSNIMVDARLAPKVLDFGLSAGEATRGHFRGTPHYLAPEQLDPTRPIDARTDVYALGAVLYELLCGARPYEGTTDAEVLAAVRAGTPRLPVEIDPRVPEPLQAIALKALERDASARYQTAREMALDLERYLDGRPVLARPSHYASALVTRVRPHLEQVTEWLRLQLIYPHEADRLRAAYRRLEVREDDWIVQSRTLSYSQIALYLGAFLLMCGSLFYFGAHRFYEAVTGVARPFAVLALPFIGLNLTAHYLYQREHRAVAVAFYLGGIGLLPLFLLILFHETGIWVVPEGTAGQFFQDGSVSNRQLQVTVLVACVWTFWLALRTRTAALSTVFTVISLLLTLAVLTDFGLREWFEQGRYDYFALHVMPLVALYALLGQVLERSGRPWFGAPLYVGAALVLAVALELVALDGRAFEHLGVSMRPLQSPDVSDPTLLDTLTAMTLFGIGFYLVGFVVDRMGSDLKKPAAWLLFTISPFAVLEPLAWLVQTDEYGRQFDWVYLGLALGIAVLSHQRQRRSFYAAGVVNSAVALVLIADHHQWFDKPWWAITLIACGLGALGVGFGLAVRERRQTRPGGGIR